VLITITLHHLDANNIMNIVQELRDQGMVQGTHFDFAFTPQQWDEKSGEFVEKFASFTFYVDKYATLFALKYGNSTNK